jgi:hypothetical protein
MTRLNDDYPTHTYKTQWKVQQAVLVPTRVYSQKSNDLHRLSNLQWWHYEKPFEDPTPVNHTLRRRIGPFSLPILISSHR